MMTMKRYEFPRTRRPDPTSTPSHPQLMLCVDAIHHTLALMVNHSNGNILIKSPQSDNNDFCSSCRGSGYLLCCDGCDRSFHFACLDPPLSQDASELQEPWFCFKCVAKRAQPQRHSRGLFSTLLSSLDKRNPSIFSLPQSIRDHFEGVATGKDGRFMEAVNGKTRYAFYVVFCLHVRFTS